MAVNRITSGLLFIESFAGSTLPAPWEAVPNDPNRYEVGTALRVRPGARPFYLLTAMPAGDFVLEAEFTFAPAVDGEHGGLVLYGDHSYQIAVQLFAEEGKAVYQWARLTKQGAFVEAYGRVDDVQPWEYLGSAEWKGPGRVGIYRSSMGESVLEVRALRCYQAPAIMLGNVEPTMTVEIYTEDGLTLLSTAAPAADGWVTVDVREETLPLRRQIRVKDAAGTELDRMAAVDLWGGDVLWRNIGFDLKLGNATLTPDGLAELQQLRNGVVEEQITFINLTAQPMAPSISLEGLFPDLSQPYDPADVPEWAQWHNGVDWATLALDSGGKPGTYGSALALGEIPANDSRSFWIRVDRQPETWALFRNPLLPESRRFKLVVHV